MSAEVPALFGPATAYPCTGLRGVAAAPGDKSLSHRAVILAALAEGETSVYGLLEADDVLRTAAAMRAVGADVERDVAGEAAIWRITGAPWRSPDRALYFGNSGTGARLVMGAVAGQGIAAAFDGDESLRGRPMGRVLDPLARMGARAASAEGRLPVSFEEGKRLAAIDYALPTASAQIKSAIILAALGAEGETLLREPDASRDHTERLLPVFGGRIDIEADGAKGRHIHIRGGQRLKAATLAVPGDPSSAAFLIAAALVVPGSDVLVRDVLVNPLRAGFYETLREMGADITFENARPEGGEPVADIRARHSALKGVEVPALRVPSMIDEYPILAVVAAFADGETFMPGVGELRVKESDRLAACEAGLNANGVAVETGADWMRVMGRGAPAGGGKVLTRHDHRIAMSFLVMGLGSKKPIEVDDAAMIATSFPTFFALMGQLGGKLQRTC